MTASFREHLDRRVLVLDGAMGTQIHAADLDLETDFQGLENCSEIINLTRPEVIRDIHDRFLAAGCDAIETNTFGASRITLDEFGLGERTREINRKSVEIAREAAAEHEDEKPRFVFGSMGPGTKLPTLGHATYGDLRASYREQAEGLADGGVDAFLIETCQDPLQIKSALGGVLDVRAARKADTPIIVSVTMEVTGTMLVGTEMAAALAILDPYPVDLISINCATGPREMGEHVRLLGQTCRKKIGVFPNAGLPQLVDGQPHYPLTPEELADWLRRFVLEDGLNLVGGCCGTTPEHMAAVVEAIGDRAPKPRKPAFAPQVTSVYSAVNLVQDNSVLLVGERSNANGSKAFREALLDEDLDRMVQIGKSQLRDGSHLLDLCTAYVGRDEMADMSAAVRRYRTEVPAPLMVDSTDPEVLEKTLELCGGRCVINSINLEDGPERIHHVLPFAKAHGAAVVALTIDEEGMAKTADDKLRIARRIYDMCVRDHGMRPEDILFDVLTFTICTGNEDDRRLGLETLEGIRRVKQELPGVGLLLGLSNISFGLSPAARHVLNSVFLHHAQKAGLTAAILHSARIEPLHHIDAEARKTAEDLIFDRRSPGYDPLQVFMKLFEGVDVKARAERELPADVLDRLQWRIVEGEREGLETDLDEAMGRKQPLEIINEDLLAGMAVVGDLFGRGEMQLPFVLQSAETMKAAVAHLEPHMERKDGDTRGKIVLATVRGDVHDIGKNLVDIILSNNGYTVFNIGIKQPIQHILEVAHEHDPDVIGMSGLLVKSTVIMRENLEEMNRRKVRTPVILGGAALTRNFVEHDCRKTYEGAVYYAKDAFEGLDVVARIVGGETAPAVAEKRERTTASVAETAKAIERSAATRPEPEEPESLPHRGDLSPAPDLPQPPFLGRRLIDSVNLQSVMPYINEVALFQFQWGYRRKGKPQADYKRFIDEEVRPIYHELMKECAREGILRPTASYGYWPCFADGNALVLLDPKSQSKEVARFAFPRQRGKKHLCISDFFVTRNGQLDTVALQVVTIGQQASDVAREWFAGDRYKDYLHLHGLSVEAAEALAEYVHRQIRGELGIAGDDAREMRDLFKQGYRGARFSFGYPACPNMEDQEALLDLLGAEEVGIRMGDEFQLWPEQSTSAIVVHHPEARYFTI